VIFWRGIWHAADVIENNTNWAYLLIWPFIDPDGTYGSILFSPLGSIIFSISLLLATGLFVSVFIGESIIMSGLRKDKKVIDKTIDEVEDEKADIRKTLILISDVKKELEVLESKVRAQCEVEVKGRDEW
jgi:hypothetical protein